ncbi:hypothetical protein QR680_011996 [Steinernema hermaphroditum]|uniref:Uncharacterized protein n=1 Tax=Steinernema hermaphroditum TaxID=289476 RepID=A0AA39I0H3_9BILA|nr:hypothetical protein QR680_011996 [Steinernema hermaphroditum]
MAPTSWKEGTSENPFSPGSIDQRPSEVPFNWDIMREKTAETSTEDASKMPKTPSPSPSPSPSPGNGTNEEELDAEIPDEALLERTISADKFASIVGEDTEQLSDVSDHEDALLHSTSTRMFTTWYKRLHPLVRNRQVRYLSIFNCLLTIINFLLLLGLIGVATYATYLKIHIYNTQREDKPCVYEWGEWSSCSHKCWDGIGSYPNKTRKIHLSTVVRARGENPACPDKLEHWRDSVSCNRYKCKQKLSSFDFGHACFFNDPVFGASKGCYSIRNVPTETLLIEVDVREMTKACSPEKCLEKENNLSTLGKS